MPTNWPKTRSQIMEKYSLMRLSSLTNEKLVDILVAELKFQGRLPDVKTKNFRMQMIEIICDQQENKVVAVSRSFDELLAACKQDWFSPYFNEKYFPLEPIAPDESKWEIYEHHFNQQVNGPNAFKRLEELGYRLCGGTRRAMEYVANGHYDIQLNHRLIVTVRWQYSPGDWFAPVFYSYRNERRLDISYFDNTFDSDDGWLVLRKKTA